MSENELQPIEKSTPYHPLSKTQLDIEDRLKIYTPSSMEGQPVNPTLNFQRIYLDFLNETEGVRSADMTSPTKQGEEIKMAREEAKAAYDSMMLIHEKISEAYREFMQMQ
jgi:hypothetical protein